MGGVYAITWDGTGPGTFEGDPQDTDPIAQGDDRIRDLKVEIRTRGETEHCWGTNEAAVCAGVTDNGRHRSGSARTFFQNLAPTAIGVADEDGISDLDSGRLWVDSLGLDGLAGTDDNYPVAVRDEGDAQWETLGVLPTNAIILWAQAQGDVNCDGVLANNECPCGFAEETAFRGLNIRGADVAGINADIPNSPGQTCPAGTGCDLTASLYDDVLDEAEMPTHHHSLDTDNLVGAGSGVVVIPDADDNGLSETGDVGNGDPHYHPFRTVLFCRYTGFNF